MAGMPPRPGASLASRAVAGFQDPGIPGRCPRAGHNRLNSTRPRWLLTVFLLQSSVLFCLSSSFFIFETKDFPVHPLDSIYKVQ